MKTGIRIKIAKSVFLNMENRRLDTKGIGNVMVALLKIK